MINMLIDSPHWLVLVIFVPLIGGIVSFLWQKQIVNIALVTSVVTVVSVVILSWQVVTNGVQNYTLGGWNAPLGIELYVDGLSLLMLLITAIVGLAISVYASSYFKADKAKFFWPLWLFLWSSLNALFISTDIFNLFVTLELIGLSSVALVALSGGAKAITAAMRYLLVSLLGSMLYLMGVGLLYHSYGSVDMAILAMRTEMSPSMWLIMAMMIVGLLLKTALFPLHFWLPSAHSSAPAPVSALLSALVVKASFYILWRLWLEVFPLDYSAQINLGFVFGLLGSAAIIWGGIQALWQTRLKLLVAYSTVMQVGYLFLAFPLASIIGWQAALYFVLAHAVAKTAMFMAAGNILLYNGHDRIINLDRMAQHMPLTITAFALAGVSLMGLPPSGGFIAKWLLLEAAIVSGQWWWGIMLIMGGLFTATYVFKVLGHAFTQEKLTNEPCPTGISKRMEWVAFSMAVLAILLGFMATYVVDIMAIGAPFGEVIL